MTAFVAVLAAFLILAFGTLFGGLWFLTGIIVIMSLLAGTFYVTAAYSVFFGAPFVPIDRRNIDEMLRLAEVRPGEKLVDLGSGDGRIVMAAARAGARAEGWEISPFLWLWSLWHIRLAGLGGRAAVHLGSYWPEKFDDADVVTLFLITSQMKRMEQKLRAELPDGARVASYVFKFPTWPLAAKNGRGVYLYRQNKAAEPKIS